jgi:peptide/nickel transport system permease protein
VLVVVRRLLFAIPLLFIVSALSFVLLAVDRIDVARQILGQQAPAAAYPRLRHQLGLDRPVYVQYWHWLSHALRGDLGSSLYGSGPVSTLIANRLPVTVSMVVTSLVVITFVGVALGVLSAVRGGFLGRFVDSVGLVGLSLPGFWFGIILVSLFAVKLRWFPAVGYVPLVQSPGKWAQALVLPTVALAFQSFAGLAKQTRESMLDVLSSEHVRMARAGGLPPRLIFLRFALKNTMLIVLTIIGLYTVGLLVGTAFIEQVFALPGLGYALISATQNSDYPVVEGIVVFFTLLIVLINLTVDVAYTFLDPRVRTS